jgi:hypothetical protein
MADNPTSDMPLEHDEYHSALEVDDSSGWRVFVVPVLMGLFFIGVILFILLYQGNPEPDPRIADRLKPPPGQEVPVETSAVQPVAATSAREPAQPTG